MQKGYKREGRGLAVLRCAICLIFVAIVILFGYFMLQLDYSDKLAPDTSMRPYVEVTPSPLPAQSASPTEVPALLENAQSTADATAAPTAVPTEAPTEAPTPEPTVEPTATPEPTPIPESMISKLKFSGFTLPELSTKTAQIGITHSYRSAADNFKYLHLKGYAYVDEASFDGATTGLILVVFRSTGEAALVLPTRSVGASGLDHANALCANPSSSDFEAVLDVSKFPDDSYTFGVIFNYKDSDGKDCAEYFKLPSDTSFSVLSSQVISDVKTISAE